MTAISTRKLGTTGPVVGVVGLGTMAMSGMYGPADDSESIATIGAALDAGANLIDTADFYGAGHSELLISRVIRDRRREDVVISVKFGGRVNPDGTFQAVPYDVSPSGVRDRLAQSLRRLGTDFIDIYRPSRLNPDIPIEETVGALREMQEAGYIRHIGLSEVGVESIRRAAEVAPIADLQIEYSLISRGPEKAILPVLRELGIGLTAYGVLSRGLLSGHWSASRSMERDFRADLSRFQGENLTANLRLVEELAKVAAELGATTSQVAIAWVAAQGSDIVPLIGARRRDLLSESLGTVGLTLSPDILARIEAAVPVGSAVGGRYMDQQLHLLDSEG